MAPPVPQAFLCTHAKMTMISPRLALCGHLFDRATLENGVKVCPVDGERITETFPCEPLKTAIANFNLARLTMPSKAEESEGFFQSIFPARLGGSLSAKFQKGYVAKIPNAHSDDIHGIVPIDDRRFVTGSKDNDIKIWDSQGNSEVTFSSQLYKTYKTWITALEVLSDGTIVSGSRNGNLTLWNQQGTILREKRYTPPASHVCKQRNMNRIHCVQRFPFAAGKTNMFFTGTACYMQLWDNNGKLVVNEEAHANDWVYCVEPLDRSRLVLAIGADLALWTTYPGGKITKDSLVKEKRNFSQHRHQRPLISSILQIQNQKGKLAITCLDGTVRTVDINQKRQDKTFQGHAQGKRVWKVVNVCDHVIASSGEDATVRLWDLRTSSEVLTISGFPDRVSCLTKLGANMLVASSCPKDPYSAAEKAEITLWDYRQVSI